MAGKIPGLNPAHLHVNVCGMDNQKSTEQRAFHFFHIRWKNLQTPCTCKICTSMLHLELPAQLIGVQAGLTTSLRGERAPANVWIIYHRSNYSSEGEKKCQENFQILVMWLKKIDMKEFTQHSDVFVSEI